jgi:hypothetical protein
VPKKNVPASGARDATRLEPLLLAVAAAAAVVAGVDDNGVMVVWMLVFVVGRGSTT